MGELCLCWAMQLPADIPLTPGGKPLQSDYVAPLFAH